MSSLFITGTDTDVGKTFTVAMLAKYFCNIGKSVSVFKPIQTGCRVDKDQLIAEDLAFVQQICPEAKVKSSYLFELAATPELAAEHTKTTIDFEKIKEDYKILKKETDITLVEGAGGLIVPIYKGKTIADLIKFLELPTVIVSNNILGTINQTSLSCSFAKAKGINLLGFLFSQSNNNEEQTSQEVLDSNARFIERYSSTKFLGYIPYFDKNKLNDLSKELSNLNPEKWIE